MKILLAPDSFKGSLSSLEVINIIEESAIKHFEKIEIIKVPIADGGEGTVEAIVLAANGKYETAWVVDPLGRKLEAKYGVINGKTAVIEMAQASGLTLLKEDERNPLKTTTFGTGQLIKDALDKGYRSFLIGIGGSATNDAGIGAAQALGVRFMDSDGADLGFGGQFLSRLELFDMSGIDNRIRESDITVISDVTNPLTGQTGATRVFAKQKGAKEEMILELENGMNHFAKIVKSQLGIDIDSIKGAGAAGGLGACLVAFFGANIKSGIDTILDIVDFDGKLEDVDLVITGEGRIDSQSAFGKVPVGVAKRCVEHGGAGSKKIPVIALVGSIGEGAEAAYVHGIDCIISSVREPMPLEKAISNADQNLRQAADDLFRLLKCGIHLGR
ncbi:glycerate kinase [Acetivibrio cellulolyticus]|uniref:glycerate kinase n=1 Tax=Acetivibrio cellulolyticus TaxID=35830 RepID=UPI0001E2C69C|nr:glycerate kinase [Acetivibrio cellulolyticus]